jgi:hypothetical protein
VGLPAKANVTDLRAYVTRRAEQWGAFRARGWQPLRQAVTDASRALNHILPLHMASEEEVARVAEQLRQCHELAIAMLQEGKRNGR